MNNKIYIRMETSTLSIQDYINYVVIHCLELINCKLCLYVCIRSKVVLYTVICIISYVM